MVSGATSVRWSIEELIEAGVVGSGFGIVNTLGVFDSIGYHYAQIVACDSELGDGDPFFVEIENDTGNFEKVKRGLA
jgi:hypothetical protein